MRMFMVTDRKSKLTFILESRSRQGYKLYASVMPADLPIADKTVGYAKVPLWIRRAARFALFSNI